MSGVALDTFLRDLDELVRPGSDARETAHAVRGSLAAALGSDDFRLDCGDRILDGLEGRKGSWRFPTIHRDTDRAYAVRAYHWPPGFANAPHRHDFWTVTGMMHGNLRFSVFQVPPDGVPVPERRIDAKAGEVGCIHTACVHNVANAAEETALTLHVYSLAGPTGDAPDLVEYALAGATPQPPGSEGPDPDGPLREGTLSAAAAMLAGIRHGRTLDLLDRIVAAGGLRSQLAAVRAMCAHDPSHAAARARELAASLDGPLGERMRLASAAILGAA